MVFQQCLSPGKEIDLKLNVYGGSLTTYAGFVYDIGDRTLAIKIDGEGLNQMRVRKGMTALLFGQEEEKEICLPVRIENSDTLPVIHIREHDSKSYVRIDGFIRLKCRKIQGKEYMRIWERYLNDMNSNKRREDKKPDLLREFMSSTQEIDLFEQQPVKVNLSGSGMRFNCPDPFQVGDLLDMKMVLSTSPFPIVRTLALVVRIDRMPKNETSLEKDHNTVDVKFVVVSENDRESIIKCTFMWQRQFLRGKHPVH